MFTLKGSDFVFGLRISDSDLQASDPGFLCISLLRVSGSEFRVSGFVSAAERRESN